MINHLFFRIVLVVKFNSFTSYKSVSYILTNQFFLPYMLIYIYEYKK